MTPEEEMLARWETMGVDAVKRKLALGHFGESKVGLAEFWIAQKENEPEAKRVREAHAMLGQTHALNERGVIAAEEAARAAEKQATYAKRAYERSNVAIWVSIITAIVMGVLAFLDYLTPG